MNKSDDMKLYNICAFISEAIFTCVGFTCYTRGKTVDLNSDTFSLFSTYPIIHGKRIHIPFLLFSSPTLCHLNVLPLTTRTIYYSAQLSHYFVFLFNNFWYFINIYRTNWAELFLRALAMKPSKIIYALRIITKVFPPTPPLFPINIINVHMQWEFQQWMKRDKWMNNK